jgi:predicted N-acetyltransferase YhbS
MAAILKESGPDVSQKAAEMMAEWDRRAPDGKHWHLGPVAVEPGMKGLGIGSRMIERFCAMMDDSNEMAHLETDQLDNVRLYERFGFEAVGEGLVIGVPNWFMIRPANRG